MKSTIWVHPPNPVHNHMARRRAAAVVQLLVLAICTLWGGFAFAQSNDDDASWQKFVDGVGAMVYKFAWPTATYERVNFQGISKTDDGVDVKIRVHGISAFDSGPLWTDVILQIRNGTIDGIRWGQNNAILAAPGETMKALGSLLVQLNKEYGQDHPAGAPEAPPMAPPPAPDLAQVAVCLSNPTGQTLAYTLKVNGNPENHSLAPGKADITWARVDPPEFTVSFDDSFEEGYTDRTMILPAVPASGTPDTCTDDMTYEFVVDGQRIGLQPRKWIPGFEHPFMSNVVRAQKEGDWQCAAGQKWASSDSKSLECVPNDVGLIGLTIDKENEDRYPKIVAISAGGAAERAGVPSGGDLLAVDGVSLDGMSLSDVVTKLRGSVNSVVQITVSGGDGQSSVFELQRQ